MHVPSHHPSLGHGCGPLYEAPIRRRIARAVHRTPFSVNLLSGIACQETAVFWLNFIDDLSPDEVLARCVLDASGDFPGTMRMAFPRNTEAFVAR